MCILQRLPAWLLFLSFFSVFLWVVFSMPAVSASSTSVVISELLTEDVTGASQEFVELTNISSETVNLSGWKIVYCSASGSTKRQLAEFQGQVQPGASILVVGQEYLVPEGVVPDMMFESSSGMSASGGHVVIENELGQEVDRFGWGSAEHAESQPHAKTETGFSYTRVNTTSGEVIDTDNNAGDFVALEPNPNGGGLEPMDTPTYQAVMITELFPDPASPETDSHHEFIELYNPNEEAVALEGYILQAGSSFQYTYQFQEVVLGAKSYAVFYSAQTSLTLANSTSRARVLDPTGNILHETDTYQNVGESEAWALDKNGFWNVTERPTPGSENEIYIYIPASAEPSGDGFAPCAPGKFRNPETNRCKNIESDAGLKPCNADQFRNPETNRCKLIASSSGGLVPCRPGQFRNPETNRCKSIATSSSSLKPCNTGQFRNPETNRCKKIESSDGLVPCKDGYERNPDTNRCRKVAGVSTTNPLSQPAAATSSAHTGVIMLVALLATGYGIYEYRQEIKGYLLKIASRSGKV